MKVEGITKINVGTDFSNQKLLSKSENITFWGNTAEKTEDKFIPTLNKKELVRRNSSEALVIKTLIDSNHSSYVNLAKGDQIAIEHLVKAADALEKVFFEQDNEYNIQYEKELKRKIRKKKNVDVNKLKLNLFDGAKGVEFEDRAAKEYSLRRGQKQKPGKNVYLDGIEPKELHKRILKMLKRGKRAEVQQILSSHTVVERSGDELKATEYSQKYKKYYQAAAKELEKAAQTSTNADFNEYLILQAKALRGNNEILDAYADKKWATLQDTPLEFTITKENYNDRLTNTVSDNKKLARRLKRRNIFDIARDLKRDVKDLFTSNNELKGRWAENRKIKTVKTITPVAKDFIGIRVGIVNKEGTDFLLSMKKHLPELAKEMPFADKYEQTISSDSTKEIKQTMVDVDLITLKGDAGAYRGGITLAENLPNNDKMSLKAGGGRRNVFHRQIRAIASLEKQQKRLNAILGEELHKYYNSEADHWFTIGHENVHSLGPKEGKDALGLFSHIIEESKADMGAIALLDKMEELGIYTGEQKKQIITSMITDSFLKAEPLKSNAHRVRSVMQSNYLIQHGAITIDEKGLIHINIEKAVPTARKMLEEIINLQLSKDSKKARVFVDKYFVWSDDLKKVAANIKKVDVALNGRVIEPLAKKLLKRV